mmetsp:Transcript_73162/g.123246  ORF Transcript_73162/g.123246 Transcript_73162/m.123246 type:complete len:97 (-) Transcript_73162:915-1205(-)
MNARPTVEDHGQWLEAASDSPRYVCVGPAPPVMPWVGKPGCKRACRGCRRLIDASQCNSKVAAAAVGSDAFVVAAAAAAVMARMPQQWLPHVRRGF